MYQKPLKSISTIYSYWLAGLNEILHTRLLLKII